MKLSELISRIQDYLDVVYTENGPRESDYMGGWFFLAGTGSLYGGDEPSLPLSLVIEYVRAIPTDPELEGLLARLSLGGHDASAQHIRTRILEAGVEARDLEELIESARKSAIREANSVCLEYVGASTCVSDEYLIDEIVLRDDRGALTWVEGLDLLTVDGDPDRRKSLAEAIAKGAPSIVVRCLPDTFLRDEVCATRQYWAILLEADQIIRDHRTRFRRLLNGLTTYLEVVDGHLRGTPEVKCGSIDVQILRALIPQGTVKTQTELAAILRIGRKTVGARLKALRSAGLTEQHAKAPKGELITSAGVREFDRLQGRSQMTR